MINLEHTKYPKIPNPAMLELPHYDGDNPLMPTVEKKMDGSNIGLYLKEDGTLGMRTRNYETCTEGGFYNPMFAQKDVCKAAIQVLEVIEQRTGIPAIIYGELMVPGYSPTRMFCYDKAEFRAFDIALVRDNGERQYVSEMGRQICNVFDLPWVDRLDLDDDIISLEYCCIENESELKNLFEILHDYVTNTHIEGVVVKFYQEIDTSSEIWDCVGRTKIKKDRIKDFALPKKQPSEEPLSDNQVMNVLQTAREELGDDYFVTKVAMPRIAALCKADADEHGLRVPKNIHKYWAEDIENRGGK